MAFELTIVTPEREVYRGSVDTVVLPGNEGDFGVLENHERFLAPLRIGECEIRNGRTMHYAAMTDGFAEVGPDHVVVLVDACELAEDIDEARAERARTQAESRIEAIRAGREADTNLQLYEGALQRALIRIQVATKQAQRGH